MPRFFLANIEEGARRAVIEGEDARHISLSLRMRAGDAITLCDGRGQDYDCVVRGLARESVELDIVGAAPSRGEPPIEVTLFQALPKSDKLETIIQKSVELGVHEIVPVVSARCVARADTKSWARKSERYGRIACEAAKQCGRGVLPAVLPPVDLRRLPGMLADYEAAVFFYERAVRKLSSIPLSGVHKLAVIVGAEGGFEEGEACLLVKAGAKEASLGNRILRCETAPIAALAAIWYGVGEM